jgi:hypothetical protein
VITNTGANQIFYPTIVSSTGTNQSLYIDSTVTPFSINPSTSAFNVGTTIKVEDSATGRVAVGANAGQTTQGVNSVAVGYAAGTVNQGENSVAIGYLAGLEGQGANSVAIGNGAGKEAQGANAIAIGNQAGNASQVANSICISATGTAVNPTNAGLYITPIRNVTQTAALGYDATNKEITYFNQNAAVTVTGPGTYPGVTPFVVGASNANRTLTVNFNNTYSSVTNYTITYTGSATTTQTFTTYTFSNAVAGGQYTITIKLVANSGGASTTTWTFNGTGLAANQKSNFTTISTTADQGVTTYVVLTIAYDGSNYFISGSTFA